MVSLPILTCKPGFNYEIKNLRYLNEFSVKNMTKDGWIFKL